MKQKEIQTIIRFLMTGGSATLIDFCVYFLLSQNINISAAKLISMTLSCVYSFFLNKKWTFGISERTNASYILKYGLSQGCNISANVLTNHLMFNLLGHKLFAYAIATGVGMTVNFLLQRFFVFKESDTK